MPDRHDPEFDPQRDAADASSLKPAVPAATAGAAAGSRIGAGQKGLWIAVGVLGTAVVALAATLAAQHIDARNAGVGPATGPAAAVASAAMPGAANSEGNSAVALTQQTPSAPRNIAKSEEAESYRPIPGVPVVTAPRGAAGLTPAQRQNPSPQARTVATSEAPEPVCTACGRVESVHAVRRSAPTSGVGAVAGGVLGAVVGNQFGHGNGRVATTLLGAAGGGYLGNTFEANSKARTVYQVRVRMEDGALRTFERSEPVAVGTPVTVEGHGFRVGHPATLTTRPAPGTYAVNRPAEPAAPAGVYSTSARY